MAQEVTLENIQELLRAEFNAQDNQLEGRFSKVDHRLEKIDHRLVKVDQQFEAVNRRFDIVHGELHAIRTDMRGLHGKFSVLQSAVDGYAARMERYDQEQAVIGHKTDRHERWIRQLADKSSAKLDY
jgi:chromosome segregation ATPase